MKNISNFNLFVICKSWETCANKNKMIIYKITNLINKKQIMCALAAIAKELYKCHTLLEIAIILNKSVGTVRRLIKYEEK